MLSSDQPCRRRVRKGDEFNKTALALPAPAAPVPTAAENGACSEDEPPTPTASEGAQSDACYPVPCKGTMQRPPTSKPGSSSSEKIKLP